MTFQNKSVTYDVTTSLELDAARGKSTIKSDAAEQIKSYIEDNLLQVTYSKLIEDLMHFFTHSLHNKPASPQAAQLSLYFIRKIRKQCTTMMDLIKFGRATEIEREKTLRPAE